MAHTPTPEQAAIIAAATDTEDNLLVSALAGAAKTSTLELLANALPKTQMLCLAFNKLIATEMAQRLPANCRVQTLNSLGLSIWKDTCRTRVSVDTGKMYRLLTAAIERSDPAEKNTIFDSFGMLLKEARSAKAAGHIPDSRMSKNPEQMKRNPNRLMSDKEMFDSMEEEPTALQEALLIGILEESLDEGLAGKIDFDDMLLLPTVYRATYPRVSLILVDEAQDLSPLNHVMLDKLARKRIIAVGDQCQAIYGFRGASSSGMADLKAQFDMTELPLTVSFRCPEAIVRHVQGRAPTMQHWEGNPSPGAVIHKTHWSVHDIPDSAAVICRNNAPLFTLAVSLLRHGRTPNLWGNDITKGLVKILKKFGSTAMGQSAVLQCISEWEDKKLKTARNSSQVHDRAECLRIFARQADTLAGAMGYAETLMDCTGPIQLMTGHKSKGHEFTHVYFLDAKLVGKDGQEPNLRYVICTRTMQELTYINTSGCEELQPEEEEDVA